MAREENVQTQQEINDTLRGVSESLQEEGEQRGVEPAYDTLELYEKVLINTPTGGEVYDELKPYMATAYFNNDELECVRRIQSILVQMEHITETIKRNLKEEYEDKNADIDDLKENLLRKLFFIAYSSKSKNGFTVLELNSQHSYHHENLYQKQTLGEEEGTLSGLKEKLGQAADKGINSDKQMMPERKESNDIW